MSYEKPCVICGTPINMYRKGNFNYQKTPLCDKPECKRAQKTALQKQRRETKRMQEIPHAFKPNERRLIYMEAKGYVRPCEVCELSQYSKAHRSFARSKAKSEAHMDLSKPQRRRRCGTVPQRRRRKRRAK